MTNAMLPSGLRLLRPRRLDPWCRLHESSANDPAHVGTASASRARVPSMRIRVDHCGLDRHCVAGPRPGAAPISGRARGRQRPRFRLVPVDRSTDVAVCSAYRDNVNPRRRSRSNRTKHGGGGHRDRRISCPDRVHGGPGRAILCPLVALYGCQLVGRVSHNRRRAGRAHRRYGWAAPRRRHGGPLCTRNENLRAQGRYVSTGAGGHLVFCRRTVPRVPWGASAWVARGVEGARSLRPTPIRL